ncbi:hypothetical protein Csa_007664 [Cucumis sativus]|nr:hypothetical protein Csa_007664 [Cucumis sativus]
MTRNCYRAVIKEQWKKAAEEFTNEEEVRSKLQFPVTSQNDTALHLAAYSGGEEPTRTLLLLATKLEREEDIEKEETEEVFWKNNEGNTPLHEAATIGNLAAVKLLVEYKKKDMLVKNIYGETPLYRAAKHGQFHIVEYLLDNCEDSYTRSPSNWTAGHDDAPIIHAAIQSENFEVVWKLIDFDESLLKMKNSQDETALQVLANMPHVFESGFAMTLVERFVYWLLPNKNIYEYKFCNFGSFDNNHKSSTTKNSKNEDLEAGSNPNCCRPSHCWLYFIHGLKCLFWRLIILGWPQWEELYKKKQKHKSVVTLVWMLANLDDSWFQCKQHPENTKLLPIFRDQYLEDQNADDKSMIYKDHHEMPLLLATARGIIEVVKTIIEVDPQAVDYVTAHNRNILHMAIVHRQKKVLDWLESQKLVIARLVKRTDVKGFTILHQVGITKFLHQHHHGPALQLQHELMWFDRVHKMVPPLYATHHNNAGWKPREYFDETHKKMLDSAKEWLKKTSESCSAVAVLVATVVFAAAFSVPGGLNDKTGSPVLLTQPLYMVFTVMDIAGLTTSLCSVVMFLSILTSSFRMDDFRHTLPMKLSLGFQLLFFSIACTMMAFALAVVLTMKSTEMKWAVSFLYLATFLPVSVFMIIQLPLYIELVKNVCSYRPFLLDILPMGLVTPFLQLRSKFMSKKFT